MQSTPESPEPPGAPQWFYPALGLPPSAEPESEPPAPVVPASAPAAGQGASGQPRQWEKPVVVGLVVACVFLLGWWWGLRGHDGGDQGLLTLVGATTTEEDGLASLSDEELFALLPTRTDYPQDWQVDRIRGSRGLGSAFSGTSIDPPECDLRRAVKDSGAVGSVQGRSSGMLLVETASAEVRLTRDPSGEGTFAAAEDFVRRCPVVTLREDRITAVVRLRAERGTVPGAEESETITMRGTLESSGLVTIPVVATMTGARSRGLVVTGSGMRAGLALSSPQDAQAGSEEADVAGQLLRTTIRRIKAK